MEKEKITGEKLRLYTDGGCNPNPGKGSWAFAVVDKKGEIIFSKVGVEHSTTNNKMELTAVIRAMERVESEGHTESVEIITDSEYVKKGLTEWMTTWKKFKWRTAAGKPVKNPDLWKTLDNLYDPDKHKMSWTRGHDGETYNEFVDSLCTEQILNPNT